MSKNGLLDLDLLDSPPIYKNKMPTQTETIVWHKLSKELPESSGHYLVQFQECGISGNHFSTAFWMKDDDGKYHWYIDCSEMSRFTVVYWAEKHKGYHE